MGEFQAFTPARPRIGPLRMMQLTDNTSPAEQRYKWLLTDSPEVRRYDAACEVQEQADREYEEAAVAFKIAMDEAWQAVEEERRAVPQDGQG